MDVKTFEAEKADLVTRMNADDLTAEGLTAIESELDALESRMAEYNAAVSKREELSRRIGESKLTRPSVKTPAPVDVEDAPKVDTRSLAERFVQSTNVQEYRSYGIGRGGRAGIELKGVEARALITTTSTVNLSPNQRIPGIVPTVADRTPRLANLMNTVQVSGNAIEYVRDNTPAPAGAAAEVPEGTLKPEATYTWELVTDTVKTIAHWTDITRQALDDEPQLQGLVQGRLFYGLAHRVDTAILNGNGLGANITGLLNTPGILTNAPAVAEAQVVTIRRSITQVQVNEYAANAVVMHPENWQILELSTDTTAAWRVTTNPQEAMTPRIWGLDVIPTTAIAVGTALVGDFAMGATLYDRQAPALYVTDSDADKFRSNIITLLAELRVGLGVNRPKAFSRVTFNGAA